jgi:hypothetical protein
MKLIIMGFSSSFYVRNVVTFTNVDSLLLHSVVFHLMEKQSETSWTIYFYEMQLGFPFEKVSKNFYFIV